MAKELNEGELTQVSGGDGQRYEIYTVQRGDNLFRIAHVYMTTIQAIVDLNPIINSRNPNIPGGYFIREGWVLKIPNNR